VLSDQQIATLATYLTSTYGTPAVKLTPAEVATLRAGGAGSGLVTLARVGMAAGVIVLSLFCFWMARRRKRRQR
jgi:hypothetical protein